MSAFSTYIMSIVGCICLTALIDILLQEGETKKYVKGISSLIIFSVILAPLPRFLSSDTQSFESLSFMEETDEKIEQNYDFLYQIKHKEYENSKERALKLLENKGIEGVDVQVVSTYGEEVKILKIVANIQNAVITKNGTNIDIIKEIKSCLSSCFLIEENVVEVIN